MCCSLVLLATVRLAGMVKGRGGLLGLFSGLGGVMIGKSGVNEIKDLGELRKLFVLFLQQENTSQKGTLDRERSKGLKDKQYKGNYLSKTLK